MCDVGYVQESERRGSTGAVHGEQEDAFEERRYQQEKHVVSFTSLDLRVHLINLDMIQF